MSNLLDIVNATKDFSGGPFGKPVRAVDSVNLTLPDTPSVLSLVGESGSGKSTLARMILGLLPPSRGHIHIHGRNVMGLKGWRGRLEFMRTVQPIFQNPYDTFNPVRPVSDALFETALNLGVARNRAEAETVISEALEVVGLKLPEVIGKYQGAFSGGQLQRLSVARALIPKPKLIVADEPVSALDASLRMTVVNLFAHLKESLSISFIYVTHDLSTAYYISDTVAIMNRGRIVEYGLAEQVLTNPEHDYTRLLVSAIPHVGEKWDEGGLANGAGATGV
jgi:peptide/nickel transport system ATP-binding protein